MVWSWSWESDEGDDLKFGNVMDIARFNQIVFVEGSNWIDGSSIAQFYFFSFKRNEVVRYVLILTGHSFSFV